MAIYKIQHADNNTTTNQFVQKKKHHHGSNPNIWNLEVLDLQC